MTDPDADYDVRAPVRTVELEAAADGAADGPPWTFSGIAVAAGDVLTMDDGTRIVFVEEELRKAAVSQADEPLTVDHPEDATGRPEYPPPTDETIGRVEKAGWLAAARGVGYEATTFVEEIARGIQSEAFDVSVHPTFTIGGKDPKTGAFIARDIVFRDLSVVSVGDSPSNTAEWGPNQALASLTASVDVSAELTAAAAPTVEDDREGVIDVLVEEHDFDREWLEAAPDDALATIADGVGIGEDRTLGRDAILDDVVTKIADRFVTEEEFVALVDERIASGGQEGETTGSATSGDEEWREYSTGVADDFDGGDARGGVSPGPEMLQLMGVSSVEEYREQLKGAADPDDTPWEEYSTGLQDGSIEEVGRPEWVRELTAIADECETIEEFALEADMPEDLARQRASLIGAEHLEDDWREYNTGTADQEGGG